MGYKGNTIKKGFPYFWRVKTRLPHRKGEPCRIICSGKKMSALFEFEDGYRVVSSLNYIRKRSDGQTI